MPIQVTCPGCLKRFSVNDKFAGQSGPCPNCRKVIKIPDKADEVVIHAPSEAGPKDSKGNTVLKPIRRKEVILSLPVLLSAGLTTLVLFGLAIGVRLTGQDPPTALLAIGAIVLAPPLAFIGYWFLRDDELEGFTGKSLWLRCGICAVVFAGAWLIYALIPRYLDAESKSLADTSVIYMFILFPIMIAIGTAASVMALELEISQGAMHYAFYFGLTLILALTMGTKLAKPMGEDSGAINAPVDKPHIQPTTPETPSKGQPEAPKIKVLQ
jgi:hypothetical protein